jgi:geranylgeranyl diphosphate synthase, type I
MISLSAEDVVHLVAKEGPRWLEKSSPSWRWFRRSGDDHLRLTAGKPLPTLRPSMAQAKTAISAQTASATRPGNATNELFLEFLNRHRPRFESHLHRCLHRTRSRFPRVGANTLATTQALIDLCERGGKRVRPALVLGGALCVTAKPKEKLLFDAAVALELLHGYFLVHDDWMDGDLMRRGGPSVHAVLRERFGTLHLGDAAAIMAGDWGVAVATDWMARLAVTGSTLQAALTCFADMQLAAVVGQIRDLVADDDDAELTYRLKTASYTVSGPLQLGAILAGGNAAQLAGIEDFAVPIGIAFQLRDDLIGVFASEERTGKPFASDVLSGKRTSLVLRCLRRVSEKDARFMRRTLGNANASQGSLRRFVNLLESSGAKKSVENRIRTLHRLGMQKLAKARLRAEGKALLESAATALIFRDA